MIGTIRWALRVIVLLLLVVIVLALLRRFIPNPLLRLAESVGIVQTEERSSASIMLEEVRELYLLQTVEYSYQAVFPYDFFPDGVTLGSVMEKLRAGHGTIEEILSEEEALFFDAYNLSRELGLSTGPGSYDFLVVPVVVTAGLDLDEPAQSGQGSPSPPRQAPWLKVYEERVEIALPEAEITQVTLRDLSSAEYGYPDVALSPQQWQSVSHFVSEQIRQRAVNDGIFDVARENAARLVESVVRQAGYKRVDFTTQSIVN